MERSETSNICVDMSRFIMHKIVHSGRNYLDETSELAQPERRDLHDFARLDLNKDDY